MRTLDALRQYVQAKRAPAIVDVAPETENTPLYITEFTTTVHIAQAIAKDAGACGMLALPYPVEDDGALPKLGRFALFTHDMIPRSTWRQFAFTRLVSVHIR